MYRNGNGIVIAPEMEESRISGGNIHPFHDLRLCDELLELSSSKAIEFALLLRVDFAYRREQLFPICYSL
jgi:hypothetical protein